MKKFFNVFYIVNLIFIYLIMLVFLLWSLLHIITRFPPKTIAIIILFSVFLSFYSLMKVLYKKSKSLHLVASVVLPALLLLSPLYYMIPIMAEAMPIIEQHMLMTASEVPDFNFMLSTMKSTLEGHDFFSFDHVSKLFIDETLPLLLVVLISIFIYSLGTYRKHMAHINEAKINTTKGLL